MARAASLLAMLTAWGLLSLQQATAAEAGPPVLFAWTPRSG